MKVSSGSSSNLDASPSNVSSVADTDISSTETNSVDAKPEPIATESKNTTTSDTRSKPRTNSFDVDDLQLESLAISDLDDRRKSSEEIRNEKDTKRRLQLAAEERRQQERKPLDSEVRPVPRQVFDSTPEDDDYNLLPELTPSSNQSRANIESMLDAELPSLTPEPPKDKTTSSNSTAGPSKKNSASATSSNSSNSKPSNTKDDLGLPDLLPNLDAPSATASSFYDDVVEDRYRIACPICGTVQYVTVEAQGTQTKCPDCFSKYQVPRPPANWTPSKVSRRHDTFNTSSPLDGDNDVREVDKHRKQMTSELLEKAEEDLETERSEEDRYGTAEFDTSGFVQRTFGFMKDPVAMGFVFGYGLVFSLVFSIVQFGINNSGEGFFGKGSALFCVVLGPLVGILFGLPMISAALAQLEAVANHQPKVLDWPGFEIFENIGDLLGVAMALGMSAIPGFLIGWYLGGDAVGSGRFVIAGVVFSALLLFPIFLLSILDSGSFVGLVTIDVLRSMREVAEGWMGYYFKSTIFTAILMILWFLLLGEGKSAIRAGIAGATFPLLVFFLFQQVGALADSIGERLSFSFAKHVEDDDNKVEDLEDSI
ncbi:MAG: MFS transporter [Pirellulales bacterium]